MRFRAFVLTFSCFVFGSINTQDWTFAHDGWLHPIKDEQVCPTYFLFAPGWLQNETAVVRYCGSTVLPTGVSVQWPSSFCTIHSHFFHAVRFAEFSDDMPRSVGGWAGCMLLKLVRTLRNISEGIHTRPMSALCPAVHYYMHCPAGAMDVQVLAQSYDELCERIPDKSDIVLYGFSRGATAALIFLATHYNVCHDKRIRAVILEAPFVDIEQLIEIAFPRLYSFLGKERLHCLIQAAFNEEIVSVIEVLQYIDPLLPLLFVTSEDDEIVPYQHVQQLHSHFTLNSDLLCLCKSSHTRYMISDTIDTVRYSSAVHQWYRNHGCSHRMF